MQGSQSFSHFSTTSGCYTAQDSVVSEQGVGHPDRAVGGDAVRRSCDGSSLMLSPGMEPKLVESSDIDALNELDEPDSTVSHSQASTNDRDGRTPFDLADHSAIAQPATPKINGQSQKDPEVIHAVKNDVSPNLVMIKLDLGPPSLDLDCEGY